mgnify:CR=1 FL=1
MKKFTKKLIAVMAIMCLSLMVFAGCGNQNAASGSDTQPTDEAGTQTESTDVENTDVEPTDVETGDVTPEDATPASFTTVDEGVLTMGTNAAFPPYEFYDGETVVGIDAEIAAAVAEKLGLELVIVDMDFSSLIGAVQSGKIDVALAGMTVTDERKENVDFSDSYATGVQVIIVPEGSDIASVDDLDGALIGVQESTTGHIYCSDDFGEDSVVAYTNGATAVQALVSGKVDCVVIDKQPALAFVEANEGLVILETEYVTEDYAAAISKDNPGLKAAFDAALQELIADGTVQAILDKYISAE